MKHIIENMLGVAISGQDMAEIQAAANARLAARPHEKNLRVGDLPHAMFQAARSWGMRHNIHAPLEHQLQAVGVTCETLLACAKADDLAWDYRRQLVTGQGRGLRTAEIQRLRAAITSALTLTRSVEEAVVNAVAACGLHWREVATQPKRAMATCAA